MQTKKRKTVGHSFRINAEWFSILRTEAEKQGISVNSLLNNLLKRNAYFRHMLRYGAITLTHKGFADILESCPDEKLRKNAVNAASTILPDFLSTMGVSPDYHVVIDLIKNLLSEYSGWFECDYHILPDREIVHLRHNLGKKWSFYVSVAASTALNSLLTKEVTTEISDSSVTIRIDKQAIINATS